MAGIKISAATELGSPADGDLLPVVDVSGASPSAKNARLTLEALATYVLGKLSGVVKADGSVPGTAMQELLGINLTDGTGLTISSGAVTATQSLHGIDTEGAASTDDLATITAAKGVGDVLMLYPTSGDRTIVLKHGTGNLLVAGGADVSLDEAHKWALCVRTGTNWLVAPFTGVPTSLTAGLLKADGSVAGTAMQELLGINLADGTGLTISSGAVTATQSLHGIDTEGAASTDDLATITAAKGVGDVLMLYPTSGDRTVVLKHGTGNLLVAGGADVSLDEAHKWALCVRTGSNWLVAPFTGATSGSLSGLLKADGTVAGTAMQELLGLNLTDPTELTIASGAITVTQSLHAVDTEADASSDDLDTITAAKGVGDVLVLYPASGDRTVVLKHGTGNLLVAGGVDASLDETHKWALCVRTGTGWQVAPFLNWMSNPMTTAGDLIIGGVNGAAARLAGGSQGQVLGRTGAGTGWAWMAGGPAASTTVTGSESANLSVIQGRLVKLDPTSAAIDYELGSGSAGVFFWVTALNATNTSTLTRASGVTINGASSDLVLTAGEAYFCFSVDAGVWFVK